jgi:hypothetical protein
VLQGLALEGGGGTRAGGAGEVVQDEEVQLVSHAPVRLRATTQQQRTRVFWKMKDEENKCQTSASGALVNSDEVCV